MPASCSASSKSASRAFVRQRIATESNGSPSARICSTAKSASSAHGRNSGSGPSARVARSVFSAPPSDGTSRLASASTCGDER
jgi:hypothetical protein